LPFPAGLEALYSKGANYLHIGSPEGVVNSLIMRYRVLLIVAFHLVIVALSLAAAFLLRFDFALPQDQAALFLGAVLIAIPTKMLVFLLARFHRGWWQFVGVADLLRILFANLIASVGFTIAAMVFIGSTFPRSIYLIDFLLCFLSTSGARFAVRLYKEGMVVSNHQPGKGLLIYGAGTAGLTLLREIRSNPSLGYTVVGFLDDNPTKQMRDLMGLPVLGCGRDAPLIVDQYKSRSRQVEEIVIAMPMVTGRKMREALANCRAAGVPCKTIPGIGELLNGKFLSAQIRNISLEDLLGREQVQLEQERIQTSISNQSVLVTGAAGSIGSELCRQIGCFQPRKLVAFDQAESELYKIDMELREKHPSLEVVGAVGDIRDARCVDELIRTHGIDLVFHAAAYKHVPMMEAHALEAVKNNVMGTWNLVRAAQRNGVSNFLMISSDKAVNPTSIMGVTKRVAELIVSMPPERGVAHVPKFVSVRFGNVLGSNGSVVPLFQAQIAARKPVTVTHPEVRRYFMSVREAVQLVLQASTMGEGAEIFVLDMGEPIRIADLARNMIRLAGLIPDEDIEIRFVGLRRGEKLYEELISEGERIKPTYHDKIKIFQGDRTERRLMEGWLRELEQLLARRDETAVVSHLQDLVPEFRPDGHWLAHQPEPRRQTAVSY
jgi:FlaA1/EpsC-like NDP-sugar epimerase